MSETCSRVCVTVKTDVMMVLLLLLVATHVVHLFQLQCRTCARKRQPQADRAFACSRQGKGSGALFPGRCRIRHATIRQLSLARSVPHANAMTA